MPERDHIVVGVDLRQRAEAIQRIAEASALCPSEIVGSNTASESAFPTCPEDPACENPWVLKHAEFDAHQYESNHRYTGTHVSFLKKHNQKQKGWQKKKGKHR